MREVIAQEIDLPASGKVRQTYSGAVLISRTDRDSDVVLSSKEANAVAEIINDNV